MCRELPDAEIVGIAGAFLAATEDGESKANNGKE
jgi:hypothetical protein